jgi:hypothetical protein
MTEDQATNDVEQNGSLERPMSCLNSEVEHSAMKSRIGQKLSG